MALLEYIPYYYYANIQGILVPFTVFAIDPS